MLGAGAWGTALAIHLAHRLSVRLWCRDAALARRISDERENHQYLPGVKLPAGLEVSADLGAVLRDADLIIIGTPTAALPEVLTAAAGVGARAPLLWLCKGFLEQARLPHQLVAPLWPAPCGVLSGPSFAEEVAARLPTAIALAATDQAFAREAANWLRDETLRIYVSDDLVGVEIGGAVKNVLAIAAGISDGLGFGHNARAALITRGLLETGRLSAALGGKRETLMGLAGLGDLVLTCTGDLSRNRRVGLELAQGKPLEQILAALGHVAEGVRSARAVRELAVRTGVDLPISEAVARVLDDGVSPRLAVGDLLRREPGTESD
ncbi:MAG: NAD(P)-dependent glycerol-3-phosphate dehydrogenase [Betaproteobacteria bacterium]|nr:NAD(P)-dependent glycerol-3-phosphate dehydrogenase [Betaproteobacteria bacterium]